jgi:hypothetical protein
MESEAKACNLSTTRECGSVQRNDWSTRNATYHSCYRPGRSGRTVMARNRIPMQGTIKSILNAVVVIVVVVWLLKVFDLFHYVSQFRVGH